MRPIKNNSTIISHQKQERPLAEVISTIKHRINSLAGGQPQELKQELKQELLAIVEQLTEFEFGQFLLQNQGGWNGEWTYKVINRPECSDHYTNALEEFLYLKAPTVLATRERFFIFKQVLQESLKNNISIASLPCGLMADLLTLDYSHIITYYLNRS